MFKNLLKRLDQWKQGRKGTSPEDKNTMIRELCEIIEPIYDELERGWREGAVSDVWLLTFTGLYSCVRDPENEISEYWLVEVGEFTRRLLAKGSQYITTLNHEDLIRRADKFEEIKH